MRAIWSVASEGTGFSIHVNKNISVLQVRVLSFCRIFPNLSRRQLSFHELRLPAIIPLPVSGDGASLVWCAVFKIVAGQTSAVLGGFDSHASPNFSFHDQDIWRVL
jgi:hypothetical protein